MEPLTVTRSVRLEADVDAAWSSMATEVGLSTWLAERVEVDVVMGAVGRSVDRDGTVRRLVVTEVEAGRRLGFTWWSDADPAEASSVSITVEPAEGSCATVTVTEAVDPGPRAAAGALAGRADSWTPASMVDLVARADVWSARLQHLVGTVAPVLAGA